MPRTKNIKVKVLINFTNQQVVHTEEEINSDKWHELMRKGYKYAGDIQLTPDNELKVYWKKMYFSPASKYLRHLDKPSTKEINEYTNLKH